MRTAIGATAVNIAKPTNLNAPMIHAFLSNIRYITIELNGVILYDTRDNVPCNMDDWRETRARFPVGSSPQIRTQWQTLCGPKQLVTPRVLLRSAPCRPLGANGQIRAPFPTIDHPGDKAHCYREPPVAQRRGPPGFGGLGGLLQSGLRHQEAAIVGRPDTR